MRSPQTVLSLAALATATAAALIVPTPSQPRVLAEIGPDGEVLRGSIDAVLDAAREGRALRVGWELTFQLPDADEPLLLEHWADSGFVTLWQGHVFAQLRDIHAQGPVFDQPAIILQTEPHGWTAIASTTGTFRQAFGDDVSEMQATTRWVAVN